MNTWSRRALLAAGFSLTVTSAAFAALSDVDPGPYTFATGGYPMWYKDSLDQSLELCQSRATSTRAPGAPGAPAYMCTLLPEPGIYDDALPLVPGQLAARDVLVPGGNRHSAGRQQRL